MPARSDAATELALREYRARLASLPIGEFIPNVTPTFQNPKHLQALLDVLEEAEDREVQAVTSVPPQHGKSRSIFHALARYLLRHPERRSAYITYSTDFAHDQSDIAISIARRAAVPLINPTLDRWTTAAGGELIWTGIGGSLTGRPIDGLLIVDDPIKNRVEAESATIRQRTFEFITSTAFSRLHPGASVIINATRWHVDDPSGRFIEQGWRHVNLPAINADGEPLWPTERPLDWLQEQQARVGPYDWASLYMGEPRPKGGTVFQQASRYLALPDGGFREATGFDAAYTAKTHADYSVALTGRRIDDRLYLTNMLRMQREPRQVIAAMKAAGIKRVTWRRSGTEKGLEAFLKELGIEVRAINAGSDKFVAAQPAAADWNAGGILVPAPGAPEHGPWVDDLLEEIETFTGLNDAHDDIIDALVALHTALSSKTTTNIRLSSGTRPSQWDV